MVYPREGDDSERAADIRHVGDPWQGKEIGAVRRRGFTLAELSMVLLLIALASAVVLTVYARARSLSKRTLCLNNVRNVGIALHMYAQDNDGFFPPEEPGLSALEIENRYVFRCPSVRHRKGSPEVPRISFLYRLGLSSQDPPDGPVPVDFIYQPGLSNQDAPNEPVLGDDQPRHEGGANVLTVDGSVQWWPAAEWRSFADEVEGRGEP